MNKKIKIFLSAVIVSLSTLVIPLKAYCNELKCEPAFIQNVTESAKYITNKVQTIEDMNKKMKAIDSIEDKKEWFTAYKNIIAEYSNIIDPPETIYDYFTDEELDLLFRVIQAEVGDEYSFDEKVNVSSVVFNRLGHKQFPNKIIDVLMEENQFQPISDGRYKTVEISEETILACEYAFQIADTTNGALFFDNNRKLNYYFMFDDKAHNFYCIKDDTNER